MKMNILPQETSFELLEALREAAADAINAARQAQAIKKKKRRGYRAIALASIVLALVAFSLNLYFILGFFVVIFLLSIGWIPQADKTETDLLRAGNGLLWPPVPGRFALLQTPTGISVATDGSAHERLAQAAFFLQEKAEFWNAHLLDAYSPPQWPASLLCDGDALVLMVSPHARPVAVRLLPR